MDAQEVRTLAQSVVDNLHELLSRPARYGLDVRQAEQALSPADCSEAPDLHDRTTSYHQTRSRRRLSIKNDPETGHPNMVDYTFEDFSLVDEITGVPVGRLTMKGHLEPGHPDTIYMTDELIEPYTPSPPYLGTMKNKQIRLAPDGNPELSFASATRFADPPDAPDASLNTPDFTNDLGNAVVEWDYNRFGVLERTRVRVNHPRNQDSMQVFALDFYDPDQRSALYASGSFESNPLVIGDTTIVSFVSAEPDAICVQTCINGPHDSCWTDTEVLPLQIKIVDMVQRFLAFS